MFNFRIVGRWSSFASKPVAVGTTGAPSVCSLLMAVRSDSSSSALNPGKTREVSRCSPPIFLLRTLQQRNGRIFLVEGVIAIYRFFLLPSLSTSISRILGAKRINADRDSRQLASGQAGYYKCMYHCLSVLFSKPIQQTALFA